MSKEIVLLLKYKNTFHFVKSWFYCFTDNYEETHKTKKKELDESVKKNTSFSKDDDKLTKEKNNNELKFNKFVLLETQNQERIDNKNNMIVETAKLAGMFIVLMLTHA